MYTGCLCSRGRAITICSIANGETIHGRDAKVLVELGKYFFFALYFTYYIDTLGRGYVKTARSDFYYNRRGQNQSDEHWWN